ncbi:MAG TPA: hypothetical protein VK674_03540 [Candidatus Limnocylindria bacterium]|nr:hypothetical protein [Candidatus Limnocylindria bacterium]
MTDPSNPQYQPDETQANLPAEPAQPEQPQPAGQPPVRRMISIKKAYFFVVIAGASLFTMSYLIPSYALIQITAPIFFYGGGLAAFVIGILAARNTVVRVKQSNKQPQQPAVLTIKALFLGILAFVGVFGSLAIAIFIASIYLSVRSCELSGSSKCY